MVVMKGIHRNNLYYLKGSTATGQVETSSSSDDDCTKVWQVRSDKEVKSLYKLLKEGIIGRYYYLQLGGWIQRSEQEEGEIQYQYSPLRRSS